MSILMSTSECVAMEQIQQLRDQTKQLAEFNAAQEKRILAEFLEANRTYPDGYVFRHKGWDCTIGWAFGGLGRDGIQIIYAVLRDGQAFNTIAEKNFNNPHLQ